MRDCACVALLALARNRSMKRCRCARSASCFAWSRLAAGSFLRGGFRRRCIRRYKAQLARAQMQDGFDRIVEKLAVVADDHCGVGIFLQPGLQPQRAFQVEIIGRLVQQQQVGFREQRGGERHAHAPAAGEIRHRTMQIGTGEAKTASRISAARAGARSASRFRSAADRFPRALRARRFRVPRGASRAGCRRPEAYPRRLTGVAGCS